MKVLLIIFLTSFYPQLNESFGSFYYKNFNVDSDFKKSRIKYPLTVTDIQGRDMTLENWGIGIDTLTISSAQAIVIAQTNVMVVLWDEGKYSVQNEFTKLDKWWYLTGIKTTLKSDENE